VESSGVVGDFVADERLLQLWAGRLFSELARLRDQFTGRKKAKNSDRPQPEKPKQNAKHYGKTPQDSWDQGRAARANGWVLR
jgi:hypothetical protein